MVPIYALVSWLSLRFITARHWLSPLRECYEAVALYSFLCYLIESLRIKTGNYEGWLEALPPQEPVWPLRGVIGRLFGVHTIERGADFMSAMRRVRSFPCLCVAHNLTRHQFHEGRACNLLHGTHVFRSFFNAAATRTLLKDA
jgi:hypothetical protein